MRGARRTLLLLFAVATIAIGPLAVAGVALAQGYPPPTNTPTPTPDPSQPPPTQTPRVTPTPKINSCARTGIVRKSKFRATREFTPGSKIAVRGKSKCAKASAKVTIKLDGRKIGSGKASKNGTYTITGTIPKSTSFGEHIITAVTGKKSHATTIEVVPSRGSESSGFATTAPIVAAWVVLAGVVAAFFVGSRRRREPVAVVAAPEAPPVPFIDTSHFVPTITRKLKRRRPTKPAAKKKPASKRSAAPKKKPVAKKKPAAAKRKPAAKKKPAAAKRKPSAAKRKPAKKPAAKRGPRTNRRPKR